MPTEDPYNPLNPMNANNPWSTYYQGQTEQMVIQGGGNSQDAPLTPTAEAILIVFLVLMVGLIGCMVYQTNKRK